jgi:hypothetical protein
VRRGGRLPRLRAASHRRRPAQAGAAPLRSPWKAQTQHSCHRGQTEGSTFRSLGQRRNDRGLFESFHPGDALKSGMILERRRQRRNRPTRGTPLAPVSRPGAKSDRKFTLALTPGNPA